MTATPKPYRSSDPISLPWQNEKPTHWELRRIKSLFIEESRKGFPNEPLLSATQSMGVVRKDRLSTRTMTAEKGLHQLKLANPGDFVISLRSFQGGIEVCHDRGIISPAYTVLRLINPAMQDFISLFFKSAPFISGLGVFITGIREGQSVSYANLSREYLALPPIQEQQAIAKFARHVDREIDMTIRAKRRLITLLNEHKKSMVHQAVTGSLTAATSVIESSQIPWANNIPSHWSISPIKRLLDDVTYGTSESPEGQGPVRVLTMGSIQDGRVIVPSQGNARRAPADLTLQRNDLLFNRTNSPELVGKVGFYDGADDPTISFASYLVRLRVRESHSAKWVGYLLNSHKFWSYARGHALLSLQQANLNPTRYGQLLVPVPPRAEQDAIVDYIERNSTPLDLIIGSTEREISLLREYRTRLISDVVTGKLDVREAAASLADVDSHDLDVLSAYLADNEDRPNDEDPDGDDSTKESTWALA